jgi:dihydrofolate reductase
MRRLIVSNLITLDGFFAGPTGEIDWFVVDQDFFHYSISLLRSVDTLLFGRTTYEGMAGYWPTAEASHATPEIAEKMNTLPKVVFSNTLQNAGWQNTTLIKGDLPTAITALKQQPGGDIVIFGSGTLLAGLAPLGLIDEYQIVVCPVVLGCGKRLFGDQPLKLKRVKTTSFLGGSVLIQYLPEQET